MPIDNLSKITSRSGINTTILLEAGNANVTGIVTAAGFDGPFTGGSGSDINAGIVTAANGLHVGAGGTIIHALSEDNGKVGIGITNPYYNLQINFNNSTTALSGGTSGNWGGAGLRLENDNTTVGAMALAHFRVYDADWHIGNKYVGNNDSDFVFNHEGSEKVRIDSDGKVGIGSDDPAFNLHIYTSGYAGQVFQSQRTDYYDNIGGPLFYDHTGAVKAKVQSNVGGDLKFNSGGTDNRVVIKSTGEVGIGTTNPQAQLDVYKVGTGVTATSVVRGENAVFAIMGDVTNTGASETDARLVFSSDGDVSPSKILTSPLATHGFEIALINDEPGSGLRFHSGTANEERLRIDSNGRLLLNHVSSRSVANITALVQLEGTTASNSSLSLTRNADTAAGATARLSFGRSKANSLGSVTAVAADDILGEIRFSGADGNDLTNHAASISAIVDDSVSNNTVPGRLVFSTATGSDPLERLRITSGGLVKINEASPVASTNGENALLQVKSVSQYDGLLLGHGYEYGTIGRGAAGALTYTGNASPGNLGGTERIMHDWWSGSAGGGGPNRLMVLTTSGNLGIGTSAPGTQLHLSGATPIIRLTDTDTSGPLHTNIDGASGYLYLDVGSIHRDVIITSAGQANEIARFTGDGLVGIATATPPDWCRFSIDHGDNGLTRFSNHSHLLLQNKNAGTTDFWSLAPRDNGSISLARGTTDSNGTVADSGSTFSISSAGRIGIGSVANSVSSFFEANYTSGTVAYPFETANNSVQSYSPFDHEVTIRNNTNGTGDNFCGIFFRPGAHSDGNRISCARISAIDTGDYRADLVFGTRGYRGGNIRFQEVLRLDSDGNASLKTGNLAFANGAGISFGATADSGNGTTDNELFDDYEEGTWTPSFNTANSSGTLGSLSYDIQEGRYIKIGSTVYIEGALRTTNVANNGNGTYDIAGLPFINTSGGTSGTHGIIHCGSQHSWTNAPNTFDPIGGATYMRARGGINVGDSTYTNGNTADFNTGTGSKNRVYFSGTYSVDF